MFAAGCGKKSEKPSSSATPPLQTTQDPSQPTATATNVAAAPDLGELNRDLLRWILSNRRKPASFEDFSATAGVAIPPPPAGKKYIIAKDMHIQLVDR
jgi:hypothetical protein